MEVISNEQRNCVEYLSMGEENSNRSELEEEVSLTNNLS
jgi:hypothetical protein